MAILVGKDTRVVVQGITGSAGSFHTRQCIAYGTQVVAGCTPGRGGEKFEAEGPDGKKITVPVFDTVAEAVKATGADTSCIFVPPLGAADYERCRALIYRLAGINLGPHKQALVNMLAEQEIPLVEDDIYGEMYFGKTRPRTCKSYDTEGLVLYCSSMSKSLAPGYRIGWCMPGRFRAQVLQCKLTQCITSASPTQAAIARFCTNGRFDLHLRHLRKALHTQCLRYTQAISAFFPDSVRATRPRGGYTLWLELPPEVECVSDKSLSAGRTTSRYRRA